MDPHQFEADPDLAFHFNADPNLDPAFHFDTDLDPIFHSDADPAAFTLMRIRIRLFSMIPTDLDPDSQSLRKGKNFVTA